MTGFTRALGKIGHMGMKQFSQCATATLRFQSASQNLIGLLTVGNVIGTGVTIGDYVIEWREGSTTGAIQLISGKGADPAIQCLHPITSEPVRGGTLYAVLRYIVIDGVRYSPYPMQGQYSPDLKACLGTVSVRVMNCSNGVAGTYSHTITYNNTLQPINNAERDLRFDLNADGSTRFFAWYFDGQAVADRMTLYYVHAATPENPQVIADWIIGSNATTNYNANPKVRGSGYQSLRMAHDLQPYGYQTGDYLRIHITPRVLEPQNTNTNWTLSLKCLSAFDCYTGPAGCRTINPATVQMIWDAANCWWRLEWYNMTNYVYPYSSWQYMEYTSYVGGTQYDTQAGFRHWGYFRKQRIYSQQFINRLYPNQCVPLEAPLRLQKTGSTYTLTYQSATNYNALKTVYQTICANANYTNYTEDTALYNHYKYFFLSFRQANSCGDTYTDRDINCHCSSVFTFDDAQLKVTIQALNTGNGLPDIACDNLKSQNDNIIAQVSTYLTMPDYDVMTNVGLQKTIQLTYFTNNPTVYDEVFKDQQNFGYGVSDYRLIDSCIPADWISLGAYMRITYMDKVRMEITNNADPAGNFRLSTYLNDNGTEKATIERVYEKQNGVQIFP